VRQIVHQIPIDYPIKSQPKKLPIRRNSEADRSRRGHDFSAHLNVHGRLRAAVRQSLKVWCRPMSPGKLVNRQPALAAAQSPSPADLSRAPSRVVTLESRGGTSVLELGSRPPNPECAPETTFTSPGRSHRTCKRYPVRSQALISVFSIGGQRTAEHSRVKHKNSQLFHQEFRRYNVPHQCNDSLRMPGALVLPFARS
jgi:hypothetical protein